MICRLDLNNAFKNGEQKECRKVGFGQVPVNKVHQFKAELKRNFVSTLARSCTVMLGHWSQFSFTVNSDSYHGWLEYRWLNIHAIWTGETSWTVEIDWDLESCSRPSFSGLIFLHYFLWHTVTFAAKVICCFVFLNFHHNLDTGGLRFSKQSVAKQAWSSANFITSIVPKIYSQLYAPPIA